MNLGLCFGVTYLLSRMKDKKGKERVQCTKPQCDCEQYTREKDLDLCSYCEHTPVAHGQYSSYWFLSIQFCLRATSQYQCLTANHYFVCGI